MEIKTGTAGSYMELKLTGRLDTNTSPEVEKVLTGIIDQGAKNLLINASELIYISSSGLRVFLVAAKMLSDKGEKLNFCGMHDYIKEVFEIAGFTVLFNFFDKREDALLQS